MSIRDSRHPAILSKCTATEFLQSLQSSDELKMDAWVGNMLGVHHNNNLKGKFFFVSNKKKETGGSYEEESIKRVSLRFAEVAADVHPTQTFAVGARFHRDSAGSF